MVSVTGPGCRLGKTMAAKILFGLSLFLFGAMLGLHIAVAHFMGNFGGPGNIPHVGFQRAFFEIAIAGRYWYAGLFIAIIVFGIAIDPGNNGKNIALDQSAEDKSD